MRSSHHFSKLAAASLLLALAAVPACATDPEPTVGDAPAIDRAKASARAERIRRAATQGRAYCQDHACELAFDRVLLAADGVDRSLEAGTDAEVALGWEVLHAEAQRAQREVPLPDEARPSFPSACVDGAPCAGPLGDASGDRAACDRNCGIALAAAQTGCAFLFHPVAVGICLAGAWAGYVACLAVCGRAYPEDVVLPVEEVF
jgi:hypothetical protein